MTRLFIHCYLDEDVDVLVSLLLRARAFEVTTTYEAGRGGSSDESQLAYAADHEMAMVTHNRVHFEKLATRYIEEGRSHWGIIVCVRRPAHEIARRLLVILNSVTADELRDQLRYI